MKRALNIILILLMLAAVVASQGKFLGKSQEESTVANDSSLDIYMELAKESFPGVQSLKRIDSATIAPYDADNNQLGRLLFTSPYSDAIIGYAGKTPLLIAVDDKNTILGVSLLSNAETPGFVSKATEKGLFKSWNGLLISDALVKKVDNTTGATYTSQAVIQSLQARLQIETTVSRTSSFDWVMLLKYACLLLVLVLALYSFFRPAKAKKFRILLLLLSFAILGIWQGSMLSLSQMFLWLTNGMSLATQWVLLIVLICALLLPMLTGKAFYCTYLCPFGAAQELMGKLNKRKLKLKLSLISWLLVFRKALLVTVVLLLILGADPQFLYYIEPFSAFSISAAPLAAIVIAIVSLALSIFITKPWCRFLCPTGQTLDFMKKGVAVKQHASSKK